jgi:hypothetical protein
MKKAVEVPPRKLKIQVYLSISVPENSQKARKICGYRWSMAAGLLPRAK